MARTAQEMGERERGWLEQKLARRIMEAQAVVVDWRCLLNGVNRCGQVQTAAADRCGQWPHRSRRRSRRSRRLASANGGSTVSSRSKTRSSRASRCCRRVHPAQPDLAALPKLTTATLARAQADDDERGTTRRPMVHDIVSPAALARGRSRAGPPARGAPTPHHARCPRLPAAHAHAFAPREHHPPCVRLPRSGGAARRTNAAPPACSGALQSRRLPSRPRRRARERPPPHRHFGSRGAGP